MSRGPGPASRGEVRWPRVLDTPVKRRLLFGGSAAVGAAGVTGWATLPWASMATTDGGTGDDVTHLHFIAHPDDDLYFFNLDVAHAAAAGHGIVNVCITGGEGNGKNGNDDDLPVDYAGYVASRYAGLRAAYAEMVQTNRHAAWKREAVKLGDVTVELATLEETPQIHLVFLNLFENSQKHGGSKGRRLMELWDGDTDEHHTLVPIGGPVKEPQTYTRQRLRDTLVALLERYQPAIVRTMDPDPDPQKHDESNPQYSDQDGYSDHIDHTAAGVIALDALATWQGRGGGVGTVVEAYRGYYNRRWPRNLSPKALKAKTRYTDIYAWNDNRDCTEEFGCGDGKIGKPSIGGAFGASTVYRYPGATRWLRRNGAGQLFATTVQQGRLIRWTESRPGARRWTRVAQSTGHRLLPSVDVAGGAADVWYAAGVAATVGAKPADHTREVVLRPFTFTGAAGEWINLGNPDDEDPGHRRGLGTPVVARRTSGLLMVAARDHRRRLAVRWQRGDEGWDDWIRLDGSVIQDGLSAIVTDDDLIEVFGAASDGIGRWWRTAESDWRHEKLDTAKPGTPPTAVALPGGGAMLVVRRAESSEVVAYYRGAGDEHWDETGHELQGKGGIGTVAAYAPEYWEDRVALATRDDDGIVAVSIVDTGSRSVETRWGDSGPRIVHSPSLVMDDRNRLSVAVVGSDGRLHIARQERPGYGLPSQWEPVRV